MTGAGNRFRFDRDLEVLEDRTTRYGHRYAIAFFDVDRFKLYNDSCGHAAGDDVLRSVTAALESECRTSDVLYRYGGEELVVILAEQTLATAAIAVERMRAAIESLGIAHPGLGDDQVITVSAGVAGSDLAALAHAGAVVKRADAALYLAKSAGRNRVVLDRPETDDGQKVLLVETSLTQALVSRAGLTALGFDVEVVRDPLAALSVAREERPDAVVTALHMQGMDGAALYNAMHADPELAGTPVVVRTADADSIRSRALLATATPDALVDKALPFEELALRLRALTAPQGANGN